MSGTAPRTAKDGVEKKVRIAVEVAGIVGGYAVGLVVCPHSVEVVGGRVMSPQSRVWGSDTDHHSRQYSYHTRRGTHPALRRGSIGCGVNR